MRRSILPLLAVALLTGCAGTSDTTSDNGPVFVPRVHTRAPVSSVESVTYLVGGSARSADITIQTPTGTSQQQGVDVPLYSKSGTEGLTFSFERGAFVYISAQNNAGGVISCTITIDGQQVSHNVAHGSYAIAQCDGG